MHQSSKFEAKKIEAVIRDILLFIVFGIHLELSFLDERIEKYIND